MGQQPVPAGGAAGKEIEFADAPAFTVAGVTDWTAVGGHGSDQTLRTSESLALETLKLQGAGAGGARASIETESKLRAAVAAEPRGYDANHALGVYYLGLGEPGRALPWLEAAFALGQGQAGHEDDEYELALACRGVGDARKARAHVAHALGVKETDERDRLAGELDEALGDPLAAVKELRRATELRASEANYLAWGSELLVHRAVWQAVDVFARGVQAYPASVKLKTAWGSALFSGALYQRAAEQMCAASDLAPADVETYGVMGKMELASPEALPCVEERLARFVRMSPESAGAHYLYAMTLMRTGKEAHAVRIEELLQTAVRLDPRYAAAWLELGKLAFARRAYAAAIRLYKQAVAADPKQVEAHYRLAVVYDRTGEAALAAEERRVHDAVERSEAEAVERERKRIKQFVVETAAGPGA